VQGTFIGRATFVAQEAQGYTVEMLSQRGDGFGLWITEGKGRPAPGSYPVVPIISPQEMPTALAEPCADRKSPCRTEWGAHWEAGEAAGRLDLTQASSSAPVGRLDVDLRNDKPPLPLIHLSARFNAIFSLSAGC
jgi:hypothetical protein